MSTANRNHHAPPTPQHDNKIYSRELIPQSREERERVSPQHLIAAIATDPNNVHPSWWWALQNIADLHHHRAQAIAHIDPDIAEKKIARWCAKTIEKGVASIQVSPAVFDNSPFDLLPSPTNSHIDQETLRTVADSIAYEFTRYEEREINSAYSIFHYTVDHRAYQWLHAALQRNATTPLVGEVHKKIFEELLGSKWLWRDIDDSHSLSGYQNRDHLCFFFGSTKAAIDFLQRVRLESKIECKLRDRICQILAKEHHDPAPYGTPPMPQVPNNENRQRWEKTWNILHHTHHEQIEIGWLNGEWEKHFTSFTRRDSMPSAIDTLRTFAARASPHAQRTLAKAIFDFLAKEKKHLEKETTPQQRESLREAVLAPLLDHDPRSVPKECYASLVCHSLEHGRTPHPMFGKLLPEILDSCNCKFVPSPSQRALAAAWALAQAQNRTENEKKNITEKFIGKFADFMPNEHNEHLAFSQAWEKICPIQEQQQHLLQHPAALLLPTPGMWGYRSTSYAMCRQAENIIGQDPIAAMSVIAALPTDALPRDSTPVLELIARNDRAHHALVEHFGHETLFGALTTLLLTAEDERQRQDAAQALAYLSQENRP